MWSPAVCIMNLVLLCKIVKREIPPQKKCMSQNSYIDQNIRLDPARKSLYFKTHHVSNTGAHTSVFVHKTKNNYWRVNNYPGKPCQKGRRNQIKSVTWLIDRSCVEFKVYSLGVVERGTFLANLSTVHSILEVALIHPVLEDTAMYNTLRLFITPKLSQSQECPSLI